MGVDLATAKANVASAKTALEAAQASFARAEKKASKTGKTTSTKKVKREAEVTAAQKALESAEAALAKAEKKANKKRKNVSEDAPPSKKAKKDVESLTAAVKAAKKTYKADKTAENKAALKAAKAELAAAEGSSAPAEKEEEVAEPVKEEAFEMPIKKSNAAAAAPKSTDPNACAKIFCGNLSFQIDEDAIKDWFKDCGSITEVKWLEDKETGRFKGCGFLVFESVEAATTAVAKNGQECMGREMNIGFSTGGDKKKNNGASKFANKPLSAKPAGCVTVFAGNLSFEIDDDKMHEFAEDCGEIKSIRWLTDRESGDFKGCGFVEFYDTASVDKFVLKNGQAVMGRPIRLDYSAPREGR